MSTRYARSQADSADRVVLLPFSPIQDLESMRADVAVNAAIAAEFERYDEAHVAGCYFGELLSAAVWRLARERGPHPRRGLSPDRLGVRGYANE